MTDGMGAGQHDAGRGTGVPTEAGNRPGSGRDLSALVAAVVVLLPVLLLVALAALLGAVVGGVSIGLATLSGTLTFALGGAVGIGGPGFSIAVALPPVLLLLFGARLAARDWGGSGALAGARRAISGDRFRIDVLLVTAAVWAVVAVLGAALMPSERLASAESRPLVTALLGVVTVLAARAIVRSDLVRRMVRATVRIAMVLATVVAIGTLLSIGQTFRLYGEIADSVGLPGPGRLTSLGVTVGTALLVGLLVLIFSVNILVLMSAHAIGVPVGLSFPTGALAGFDGPVRSILDTIAVSPRWIVVTPLVILLLLWVGWTLLPTTDVRGVVTRGALITLLSWFVGLFALPLLSMSFRLRANVLDVWTGMVEGITFREEITFILAEELFWSFDLPFGAADALADALLPGFLSVYDAIFTVNFAFGLGAGGSTFGLLVPAIVAALFVMLGSLVRAAAEQPEGRLSPDGLHPRGSDESALRFGARYVGRSLEVLLEAVARRWEATAGARSATDSGARPGPDGPNIAPPPGPPAP